MAITTGPRNVTATTCYGQILREPYGVRSHGKRDCRNRHHIAALASVSGGTAVRGGDTASLRGPQYIRGVHGTAPRDLPLSRQCTGRAAAGDKRSGCFCQFFDRGGAPGACAARSRATFSWAFGGTADRHQPQDDAERPCRDGWNCPRKRQPSLDGLERAQDRGAIFRLLLPLRCRGTQTQGGHICHACARIRQCVGKTWRARGARWTATPVSAVEFVGAHPPHPLALPRARRERPRNRSAKQRAELAPSHLISLSVPSSGRSFCGPQLSSLPESR